MERNEIEKLVLAYPDARTMADHLEDTTGEDWQVKSAGFCIGDENYYRIVFVEPEPILLTDLMNDSDELSELDDFFAVPLEAGDLIGDPVEKLVELFSD
jgi:hypothetical protein